ncbi:MAG: RsmD family RNA methyltransferase [Candidatus Saccharibacteria bacterium]
MRVIAGTLGGRTFDSPHNARTHPMSDKIRGALFNTLGDIEDLTVLDAFAGSGALCFEAISRGAQHAYAIENDKSAQRAIAANITALGLADQVTLAATSASSWLAANLDQQFDIVLLDPPYDNVQPELIQQLAATVKPDGIMVLSWPGDQTLPSFGQFGLVMSRSYGDAQLAYYQR